jgi:hypothetical protein
LKVKVRDMEQLDKTAASEGGARAKIADEVLTGLKDAIVQLLRASAKVDPKDKVSLVWPAHLLLLFGLLVISSSIVLRFLLGPVRTFAFQDFLALLVAGCALVAMGALLYIYQLASERATLRALSRLTEDTARDLAAQTDSQPQSTSQSKSLNL